MLFKRLSLRAAVACIVVGLCVSAYALSQDDVYYGNHRKYKKAAEVCAKKVFIVIPAYKEIIDKKISEDSAVYLVKLAEANKVFKDVVEKYAKDNGYDLVCEEGKVDGATLVTDDVKELVTSKSDE